ncbi:hypothetical protein NEOC84_000374|uniref:hypothetical protein n=1 Tax=Neochlamydia sp. AcF84 TaxID=2315858 RepID=UPI00140BF762|nr:hypothetical protein [Neochlamydia sp. AcF84]NGY94494.1 hypothetical protein [Neochlamydia sp. AcF84]
MNISFTRCWGFYLFILWGILLPLQADPSDQGKPTPSQYPPPPSKKSQAYMPPSADQNYNNITDPSANPSNMPPSNPPGFYGGFYGSPPPPTAKQSFPDKAAADELYKYIQSR